MEQHAYFRPERGRKILKLVLEKIKNCAYEFKFTFEYCLQNLDF